MAVIWTSKQPWLRRPSGPVEVDWSSPLARRLVRHYPASPALPVGRDICAGAVLEASGAPIMGAEGVVLDGASYLAQTAPVIASYPFTLAAWFRSTSSADNQSLLSLNDAGDGTSYWALQIRGADVGDYLAAVARNPSWTAAFSSTGYVAHRWHLAIGVYWSATSRISYLDGSNAGSDATNVGFDATSQTVSIGTLRVAGPTEYLSGTIGPCSVWSRALSPAEVWALHNVRTRWSIYAPLVRRTYVDVGGGASNQTLMGAAAVATWTLPSVNLTPGAVALVGSTPTVAWTVPSGALAAGAVALSGAPAAAAWTVPAQALTPGAVALSGTPAASIWTVDAQALAPGVASLSGAPAVSAWTVPTGALAAGDEPQTLVGDPAVAAWTVPAGAVTAGSVALSGAAAASAWAVPAQALTPGAVALTGTPAVATWTIPTGTVTQAGATLTGDPAVSTWGIDGVWSIAPVALVGSPASSTWTLPTGTWPFSVLARRLRVLLASRSRARLGASRTRARIRASQD